MQTRVRVTGVYRVLTATSCNSKCEVLGTVVRLRRGDKTVFLVLTVKVHGDKTVV